MPRFAYVNGFYVRHDLASTHVEDRGYQFADGVYEVCGVLGGQVLDFDGHWARFERSLDALSIPLPMAKAGFRVVLDQMIARNRLKEGMIYYQATRGVAARDHALSYSPKPSLVATARRLDYRAKAALARKGVHVISVGDERWARCDIKSISLLGNVMAKDQARKAKAYEAWMVKGNMVTEGSSTNTWIIDQEGVIRTHPLTHGILGGITRETLVTLAQAAGLKLEEQAFGLGDVDTAREAFLSSSTNFVMPVISVDGKPVGDEKPGPISLALAKAYWDYVESQTGVNYWS